MNLARIIPQGLIALTMSIGVTAGSIYVTVNAAASNSAATIVAESQAPAAPLQMTAGSVAESSIDVPLTADGSLTAKISTISIPSGELQPAAGVKVTLTATDGVTTTTSTDSDGFCAFGALTPGLYTVNASGSQGKLSYGIRAVSGDYAFARTNTDAATLPVSVSMEVTLDSALTPARDAGAVQDIISGVVVAERQSADEPSEAVAIEASYAAGSEAVDSSYLAHEAIRLTPEGSLEGQVSLFDPATGGIAAVKDLTVNFISDNVVVASTSVESDGSFVQWNLLPGIYSLVVAGSDGVGYMGIHVVSDLAQRDEPGLPIPTAVRRAGSFNVGIVGGSDGSGGGSGPGSEDVEDLPPGAAPFGGGPGSGGGSVGGGGAGAGGGGWGELLGAAAIGLGAAALASDDDGAASPGI